MSKKPSMNDFMKSYEQVSSGVTSPGSKAKYKKLNESKDAKGGKDFISCQNAYMEVLNGGKPKQEQKQTIKEDAVKHVVTQEDKMRMLGAIQVINEQLDGASTENVVFKISEIKRILDML